MNLLISLVSQSGVYGYVTVMAGPAGTERSIPAFYAHLPHVSLLRHPLEMKLRNEERTPLRHISSRSSCFFPLHTSLLLKRSSFIYHNCTYVDWTCSAHRPCHPERGPTDHCLVPPVILGCICPHQPYDQASTKAADSFLMSLLRPRVICHPDN